MNHYTYRAEWSPDDDQYVGLCLEIPSLVERAPTLHEAIAAIERAVDQYFAEAADCGREPPTPLAERQYSGKFVVRTSRALHARLAVEATEQGVSMNQWIVQKLAGRPLVNLFDFD